MKFPDNNDEFYIGYHPKAPPSTSRCIKAFVSILCVMVVAAGVLISISQRPFSNGRFEYGILSPLSGVYFSEPIPHLFHPHDKSITMLVGFGKMGAQSEIDVIEQSAGISLEGTQVTLRGSRIYDQGKHLLQIAAEDNRSISYSKAEGLPHRVFDPLGAATFSGEVVDPKCFFGVMKPGEGTAHRSCAIRCISGGIPPVLLVRGKEWDHIIIAGPDINRKILPIVGEPVVMSGMLFQYQQWKILKADLADVDRLVKGTVRKQMLEQDKLYTFCNSSF